VRLWQKAAEYQEFTACLDLAKYYEHRLRDYQAALEWTSKASLCLDSSVYPIYFKKNILVELQKRQERLNNKLNRHGSNNRELDREEE